MSTSTSSHPLTSLPSFYSSGPVLTPNDIAVALPTPTTPVAVVEPARAPPEFTSKSDLKQAILNAIIEARKKKAERKALGLPSESESDSDTDSDTDSPTLTSSSSSSATVSGNVNNDASICKNDYGMAQYWNQRYAKTRGLFDWYVDYNQLEPLLEEFGQKAYQEIYSIDSTSSSSNTSASDTDSPSPLAPPQPPAAFPHSALHLLDIGCGNSGLGAELYDAGWSQLTHIDISDVIIERMKAQYASKPGTNGTWLTMDATRMTFPSNHIDIMIEKGTIDALDCTPEEAQVVNGILTECSRVIKPGGVLLIITHGGPRRRLPVLLDPKYNWRVETRAIGYSNSALFIRLLRKKMGGLPLAQAPPALMAECAASVRETKQQMETEIARAKTCIAQVESEFARRQTSGHDSSSALYDDCDGGGSIDDEQQLFSPTTSSICFVYACTKRR